MNVSSESTDISDYFRLKNTTNDGYANDPDPNGCTGAGDHYDIRQYLNGGSYNGGYYTGDHAQASLLCDENGAIACINKFTDTRASSFGEGTSSTLVDYTIGSCGYNDIESIYTHYQGTSYTFYNVTTGSTKELSLYYDEFGEVLEQNEQKYINDLIKFLNIPLVIYEK